MVMTHIDHYDKLDEEAQFSQAKRNISFLKVEVKE